jgi:hypothetical protein
MLLNREKLLELSGKLDEARVRAVGDSPLRCDAPIKGDDGKDYRVEKKPKAKVGARVGSHEAKEGPDGVPEIHVPYGLHGRAYLAIDPDDGSIWCAACNKKLGEGH